MSTSKDSPSPAPRGLAKLFFEIIHFMRSQPDIKDADYEKANDWGDDYIEKYLDGKQPAEDKDSSELIYEHALEELRAVDKAIDSINSKCSDLMKLLIAVVGAIVTAWKLLAPVGNATWFVAISNWIMFVAVFCFIVAMVVLARCLRSQEYIPAVSTRRLLEWAGEKGESSWYIRMRVAVRIERVLAGNRKANAFVAHGLDLAWILTTIGFGIIAVSLLARFF